MKIPKIVKYMKYMIFPDYNAGVRELELYIENNKIHLCFH